MRKCFKIFFCLLAVVLFAACGDKKGNQHSHHDHHHDAHTAHNCSAHRHDHEGHHQEEHCVGHDHEHDRHNQANSNHVHAPAPTHDHAHGLSSHSHAECITFSKHQAAAVGLQIEEVSSLPFYNVIKTAGHLQTPIGSDAVVVATSSGVLYYTIPSFVEGQSIRKNMIFAGISAKKLQDGDPLLKAKLTYETAKSEYERAQRLVHDKIVSDKEFEQIRLHYETAKTTYEGQAAGMTENGVSLSAPISGYLKQLLVSNGSYVEVGQPVAVITQIQRLQLTAQVSERDFSQLSKVSKAYFKPTYTDSLYKTDMLNGRLLAYGRASEGAFVPVTFEIDNVGDLIVGSYADVYLLTQPEDGIVSVPVGALTEEQGLYYVYLQVCAEEYMKREVHPGRSNGERVEILRGLHYGERVVTHGAYQVKLASMTTAIPHGHSH